MRPEDVFARAPPGRLSLDLKIEFEYKDFIKNNPWSVNTEEPMRIYVLIPYLDLYFYDVDYRVICKYFAENLGE